MDNTLNQFCSVKNRIKKKKFKKNTKESNNKSLLKKNISIYEYINDDWDNKYLSKELVMCNYCYNLITDKHIFGLYTMPLFSKVFCNELLKDLKKFDGFTNDRHIYYKTNDILLSDYNKKLFKIYDSILRNIMLQFIHKIYTQELNEKLFYHETFIVRYRPENQSHLNPHHDTSVFSCITNLSPHSDYEGGGTYFVNQNYFLKPNQGHVTVHPGALTHRHGVRPVTKGERYVIVSFCRMNW